MTVQTRAAAKATTATAMLVRAPYSAAGASAAAPSKLQELLSGHLGPDVISLVAQDHYVEVTTTLGSGLILSRLSDAIAELAQCPGAQLHRSHWVARAHVRALLRGGGKPMVRLSDGRELAVSEARLPKVRRALGL